MVPSQTQMDVKRTSPYFFSDYWVKGHTFEITWQILTRSIFPNGQLRRIVKIYLTERKRKVPGKSEDLAYTPISKGNEVMKLNRFLLYSTI